MYNQAILRYEVIDGREWIWIIIAAGLDLPQGRAGRHGRTLAPCHTLSVLRTLSTSSKQLFHNGSDTTIDQEYDLSLLPDMLHVIGSDLNPELKLEHTRFNTGPP